MAVVAEGAEWLSLAQAAARLGIHPTTLRRWANQGQIPVSLTPGGHRRFRRGDLETLAIQRRQLKTIGALEQTWAGHALHETRRELSDIHLRPAWLSRFDDEARLFYRQLSLRLMGVCMQYLAGAGLDESLLEEARWIGKTYGDRFLMQHVALSDGLSILAFFRSNMLEAALQVPEAAQLRPEASQGLVRRLTSLLDAVELGIATAYERSLTVPLPSDHSAR